MTRAVITVRGDHDRERAAHWAMHAHDGMRIEFKDVKRSGAQNDKMWALLSEVAAQVKHADRKYTPEQWKVLFLHAIGQEVQFMPSLDNSTFIPWGFSSSDLSKEEMTSLIEFILSWGAEHGVTFSDPESNSSDAQHQANPRDLTDTPAAVTPPSSAAAGVRNFEEASLLSDDWRDVYINAMSGVRDRPASLKTRNSEAWQMIGGEPNNAEKALMRKIWNLVFARDTGKLGPGEFETEIEKLRTAPLPAAKEAA